MQGNILPDGKLGSTMDLLKVATQKLFLLFRFRFVFFSAAVQPRIFQGCETVLTSVAIGGRVKIMLPA